MTDFSWDIVIAGAGMAGASLAAELAPHASVLVLEAEETPGYHATGRSAAFWVESYGGPQVQPLTTASGPWLETHGFLRDRGGLNIGRADQLDALDRFEAEFAGSGVRLERWDRAMMEARVPGLRREWIEAVYEPDSKDIDVGAVHAHYLAQARGAGAQIRCRSALAAAERVHGGWQLTLADGSGLRAGVLVDAAGAWADEVARKAGLRPLGIQPLRRTMLQLRVVPAPADELPVVLDIGGSFYFKPENGRLWLSPHDETPSQPCDAAPEELDLALAIERFEGAVDWRVEQLEHKWAGLRSFAPDRLPIYGYDPREPGFFWFAGQGGFGIQTAPAAARFASQLLLDLPADAMTGALDAALYDPARFSWP
ncbi:MAG: FAD-dependent oxidoreductase [Novosphingobium sp.]|nr:FAD-dependent oxidoreductase [Novosphingobium sp.]